MSGWISVKDRLPKCLEDVLVYCQCLDPVYKEPVYWTTVGWRHDGGWNRSIEAHNVTVTHWMPLPEPPEKEKYHDDL